MVEGIDCYARCLNCGDVCWTEVSEHHQAVVCSCGFLEITNEKVTRKVGGTDRGFKDEHFRNHVAQEKAAGRIG